MNQAEFDAILNRVSQAEQMTSGNAGEDEIDRILSNLAAPQPTAAPQPEITSRPIPVGPPPGRSPGQYISETTRNIPGSMAGVVRDLSHAVENPVDTAMAVGKAAVGGVQLAKDAIGFPTTGAFGDQRQAARDVGQFYSDRYGGGQEALDTFRTDPVAAGLDIGGLLSGGATTAVRAPGTAGRIARGIARADPTLPAAEAGGRAIQRVRGRAASRREFVKDAPTPDQLQGQASTLYKQAEQSGVRFDQASYSKFVDDVLDRVVDEGAADKLTPTVGEVANILSASKGKAPSIREMDILRRQFGLAAGSTNKAEARIGRIMVDALDDFVEQGAGPVSGTLAEARGLWSRLRKSEVIDNAIENATASQAGVEAGLRNEFRTLWKARHSKKMRDFTDAELDAIKKVATGNFSSNVLRRIGSLSGGIDQQRNMWNMFAGMGAGGVIGGAPGAIAVPAVAYGAARGAKRMTQNQADLARAITARGETPPQAPIARPQGALEQFLMGWRPPSLPARYGARCRTRGRWCGAFPGPTIPRAAMTTRQTLPHVDIPDDQTPVEVSSGLADGLYDMHPKNPVAVSSGVEFAISTTAPTDDDDWFALYRNQIFRIPGLPVWVRSSMAVVLHISRIS